MVGGRADDVAAFRKRTDTYGGYVSVCFLFQHFVSLGVKDCDQSEWCFGVYGHFVAGRIGLKQYDSCVFVYTELVAAAIPNLTKLRLVVEQSRWICDSGAKQNGET